MPKLSVITINYNNAHGLEKTVNSVLSQTYNDFEYIIIDGGSTDESVEIINKNNDKISYWVSENDKGIYDAQNKGIDNARGEYCLFLNSGDYLYENQSLQKVFSYNTNTDIISCDMVFDYGNKIIAKKQPESPSNFYLLKTTLWHPATLIKRSLFGTFGKYNLEYKTAADYDFFLKVLVKNKSSYQHIHNILSVFDTTGVSSSTKSHAERKKERLSIQKKYFSSGLIFLNLFKNNSILLLSKIKRFLIR